MEVRIIGPGSKTTEDQEYRCGDAGIGCIFQAMDFFIFTSTIPSNAFSAGPQSQILE
jgi:hypothetical protein